MIKKNYLNNKKNNDINFVLHPILIVTITDTGTRIASIENSEAPFGACKECIHGSEPRDSFCEILYRHCSPAQADQPQNPSRPSGRGP